MSRGGSQRALVLGLVWVSGLCVGAAWSQSSQRDAPPDKPSERANCDPGQCGDAESALDRAAAHPDAPPRGERLEAPDTSPRQGLSAAWADLRLLGLARAWDELLSAPAPGALGGPHLGASWRQLIDFYDGRAAFQRVFTAAEGLGPTYNDTSCANCHNAPNLGGGGADIDHGVRVHGPPWTGGDAMGLRKHAAPGFKREVGVGTVARLRSPPLYGLGVLDAIPNSDLDALADPDDRDGDGVRGVRGYRNGGRVRRPARFGQKANEWDLPTFAAGAMVDEMGLTNRLRRDARGDHDAVADPEVSDAFMRRVQAYVLLLGRPPAGATTDVSERGAEVFERVGCVGCHRATIGSGTHRVRGAYTDMLLHDMGPSLDSGIKDGVASGAHWRTAPLWGLRFRHRYLHDNRAATLDAALAHHQGEAKGASDRYRALPPEERAAVRAFLRSL